MLLSRLYAARTDYRYLEEKGASHHHLPEIVSAGVATGFLSMVRSVT